jgi:hypothetical protein
MVIFLISAVDPLIKYYVFKANISGSMLLNSDAI